MDKELNPLTGDYTGRTIDTLQNAVYIRLRTPLGTWWADRTVGSLLHLLEREKDVARVAQLAEQYAQEALQPIVDSGRAERIDVAAEQPHNGSLILRIRVQTAAGGFDYRHKVPVI
ncbi:phage GP46 family protein [Bergeriella denitrificans]|uniref:Phage protein GP46 n=1 Tax=Bergeriella denitrificans TaxID=494 RepID=A0A378UE30_BERDE|nr:phage GP46 family protein [Bergeriella denitrificans]STZ75575.1 Phage protein GP46 [Bergeriella denitrificans]